MMYSENIWLISEKHENAEKFLVDCVEYGERLMYKNISPFLNEVLKSIVKCIDAIKANVKCKL